MSKNKSSKSRKKHFRRFVLPILLALLVIACMSFALTSYFAQEEKMAELRLRNSELTEQSESVKAKKAELKKLLENWNTPEYIEKIAREEFGMIKPGEVVFGD